MPSRPLPFAAPRRGVVLGTLLALAGVLGLTACAGSADGVGARAGAGRLSVVTSFYPLQFAAEQIGGSHVSVSSLTKPGAEPHELELTPREVATVATARVVIYEKHLQPAVDQAVASEAKGKVLDVVPAARLDLRFTEGLGESRGDSATSDTGSVDPHFWLDPIRYRDVAHAIAGTLSAADPAHSGDYQAGAAAFAKKLTALNADFATGLAHCDRTEIVTSHNAFGYLARRYHLTQVGITGLSPDAEPAPGQLGAVATYAKEHGVTTIYAETLASPAVAETVAKETGATVKILDPIEGLTSKSAGTNYFEVMHANLATLQAGQGCS